jgi:hypothetical protein
MLDVVRRAWGVEPEGALHVDEIPAPDAEWARIGEFSTFDGYAHFGEDWGRRFNAVRERWFETGSSPATSTTCGRACSSSSAGTASRGATTSR